MTAPLDIANSVEKTTQRRRSRNAPYLEWGMRDDDDEGRLAHRLALRSVAAYFAHEINHPLGTISNLASLLGRQINDPVIRPSELTAEIDSIKQEIRRAADVIKNLRVLAGGLHGQREKVNLHSLLKEAVSRFRRRYRKDAVSTRIECPDRSLEVQAVPDLLHIALYNLLVNGTEAGQTDSAKRPRLILRAKGLRDGQAVIDVIDNGPGVPDAIKSQVFEPFVSNKASGSGLGLAICRDVVEWHGGTLSLEQLTRHTGACFRVSLPRD